MPIEWTSQPATKTELSRGRAWSYRLPLRGTGIAVTWTSRSLPKWAMQMDEAEPDRIVITVPDDLDILFGELAWTATADHAETVSGTIVFRVVEPLAPGASPAVTSTAPPAPIADKPTSAPAKSAGGSSDVGSSAARPSPPPADKPAAAAWFIEVLRGGATVPGLRADLQAGRTLVIGRGGTVGEHALDLAGRFETDELEACCSRRQAEVFCSAEGVFIRSIGRSPLQLVDASGSAADDLTADHRWAVGETIALPGKLRVILRERRP